MLPRPSRARRFTIERLNSVRPPFDGHFRCIFNSLPGRIDELTTHRFRSLALFVGRTTCRITDVHRFRLTRQTVGRRLAHTVTRRNSLENPDSAKAVS